MSNARLFAWGFLLGISITGMLDTLFGSRDPEWSTPAVCAVFGLLTIALFGDRARGEQS